MIYDLIIIGGGPAGLTAAIYALRAGLTVLMIEKAAPGGQITLTNNVENYPGYVSINGYELATKMFDQAQLLGLETVFDEVVKYDLKGEVKKIHTLQNFYESKTVILALGAKERELAIDDAKKFANRGISYCANCDGALYKNKDVAIVGGGNTSFDDCIYLSGVARKVYLIHRSDSFKAEEKLVKQVKQIAKDKGNIEFVLFNEVKQILGSNKVEAIVVENSQTKQRTKLEINGLFVAIGRIPQTQGLNGVVNLTADGYIITDEKMQTNVAGVFASGDARDKTLRQIVTATSDGAMAAISAHHFVKEVDYKFKDI